MNFLIKELNQGMENVDTKILRLKNYKLSGYFTSILFFALGTSKDDIISTQFSLLSSLVLQKNFLEIFS